jgi:hypothetical protein
MRETWLQFYPDCGVWNNGRLFVVCFKEGNRGGK